MLLGGSYHLQSPASGRISEYEASASLQSQVDRIASQLEELTVFSGNSK